jgi:hypothetical protein
MKKWPQLRFITLYNFIKINLFILVIFGAQIKTNAQENNSTPIESWYSSRLDYKFSKDLKVGLEGSLRYKKSWSEINNYFGEIFLQYEPIKRFEITGGGRFIRNNDTKGKITGWENHARWFGQVSYAFKFGRLKWENRLRYQNQQELIGDAESDARFRPKTYISYDFRKWKLDPELSAEMFSSSTGRGPLNSFMYRYGISTSYKFNKTSKLKMTYYQERYYTPRDPDHIISLKYFHSIN